MELTLITVFESTPTRLNFPFKSVAVPTDDVPLTETVTPGIASPFMSLTIPVIVFVCAKAVLEKISKQTKNHGLNFQEFSFL
jgi:hypothetical protein